MARGGPRPLALREDAANWAQRGVQLRVSEVPRGAVNLNVDGKCVVSPRQGVGKMWQKTYRICWRGIEISLAEVIGAWKANFQAFWPRGNRFYVPLTGIAPGEVALLNIKAGGCRSRPASSYFMRTTSRPRS